MKLITHKFGCRLIKLFRLGNRQLELIFCSPNSIVPRHCHPSIDSLIIHLRGKAVMERDGVKKIIQKFSGFNCFFIEHGVSHGLIIANNWFIFLNYEVWFKAVKPSSAAEDIAYE